MKYKIEIKHKNECRYSRIDEFENLSSAQDEADMLVKQFWFRDEAEVIVKKIEQTFQKGD